MQDEETGKFRLWYIAYHFDGNFYRWGYATSPNGLQWEKPELGLERFGNTSARNCLPLGPHPEKGTRSIARDPRPETPAERRYLGVRFTYEGEFVSFSPDGIAWAEHPSNPVWRVPSDIIHIFWDEQRRCFAAYYKLWEVSGIEVDRSGAGPEKPFVAYMPTFTPQEVKTGETQFEGPRVIFAPNGPATVAQAVFTLRSGNQGLDDGGGTSLSGKWTAKRVQAWARSSDGIHWGNEQLVLRADSNDPPTSNIQFLFVMQHGGYYVGFLTVHDETGFFRIQLAWSEDGLRWHRPWREPWLDVGTGEDFDRGMVLGPGDPIVSGSEMWFPYGGFPIRHDSKETNWESAVGLATTRLDGFAAWEAGAEAGELITRPFRCTGDRLFVNADARSGSVQVEVLTEDGVVKQGFDVNSCHSIHSDTLVETTDGWVRWTSGQTLDSVRGQIVQLRFQLTSARLFSFRVADAKTEKLPVPRATHN